LKPLSGQPNHPDCQPKLTMGLSPTLLTLLDAPDLKQRFPTWLEQRQQLLPQADPALRDGADHLSNV
jgi:1,4-alpha-glucan branching enzyme